MAMTYRSSQKCSVVLASLLLVALAAGCMRFGPRAHGKAGQADTQQRDDNVADNVPPGLRLPDCDVLLAKFFSPELKIRPDIERAAKGPGPLDAVSTLRPEERTESQAKIEMLLNTAVDEWPNKFGVPDTPSLQWVQAFDRHYARAKVKEVISRADPAQSDNEYVSLCGQFGAVLGEVLHQQRPTLVWLYAQPYWESALYDEATGYRVNVFHWAIKKMSDYGVDDGFGAKTGACINLLQKQTTSR